MNRAAIALAAPLPFLAAMGLWSLADFSPRIDGRTQQAWEHTTAKATAGLSDAEIERFRQAIEVLIHEPFYFNDGSYGQDVYDARTRWVCNGRTVREVIAEADKYQRKKKS